MITYEKKKVKIFLKNGMATEGTVISWNTQEVLLKNDEGDCTLIIYEPRENILMAKVYEERKPLTREERDALREEVMADFESAPANFSEDAYKAEMAEEFKKPPNAIFTKEEVDAIPTHNEIHIENIENLAELQKAKAKAERDQIAKKLKSFLPNSGFQQGKYVPPYSKK